MRRGERIWRGTLFAAAVLLAGFGFYFGEIKTRPLSGVTVYGAEDDLSPDMLDRAEEAWGEPVSIALWKDGGEAWLGLENEGGKKKVTSVLFAGDMELFAPVSYLSGGPMVWRDNDGCVITFPLALSLFGSVDVTGLSLTVSDSPDGEEGRRVIRGVADTEDSLIFYCPEKESFSVMEARFEDERNGGRHALEFLAGKGANGGEAVLDGEVVRWMSRFWYGLSLWMVILAGVQAVFRPSPSFRPSSLAAAVFVWCGLWAVSFLILGIPGELLPGRLSDFSFYEAKAEQLGEQFRLLRAAEPSLKHRLLRSCLGGTAGCSSASLVLLVMSAAGGAGISSAR